MNDGERSASGSPIFRHEAPPRDFVPAVAHEASAEVEAKISGVLGEPTKVFHEIGSDLVHVDVHVIPPTSDRNWWTLFTTGMSDLPMTVPEGLERLARAELTMKLPSSWRVDLLQITPPPPDLEAWYWPIYWLKTLARMPHDFHTWFGFGHSVPNGDPPVPFAPGTELCGWLLLPPLQANARSVDLDDGTVVQLYVLHALLPDELKLKLDKGTDTLLDAFDAAGVTEVVDPVRRSAIKKGGFGLFSR